MQSIKKIADWALKYGVLAWAAMALVWFYIVTTMRNGISCDEGYYLMGYLRGQNVEGMGTDFHSIVRALCRPFPDDDIMVFRYLRLVLNVLALTAFAFSSYDWLSKKKGLKMSRWAYCPLVALAGAMSFTFAAPTISYDSIELIIVLLVASLLFVLIVSESGWAKSLSAFGMGFLLWFACSNYPTAGVCLVVLFVVLFWIETNGKRWKYLLIGLLGVFAAILVSHFFVHDMRIWFSDMSAAFVSAFTEESKSRHDAGSLVSTMLITVGKEIIILLPVVVLLTFLFKKVKLSDKIQWIVVLLLCVVLLVVRQVYEFRGTLLLIPVALVLAKVLSQPELKMKDFLLSKESVLILVLVAIPLAGVFGTNQAVMKKAVVFTPFWMLAFVYLMTKIGSGDGHRLTLLYVTMLMAGYFYLGNFQRYHYYYTPRSSRVELVDVVRPQKVLVNPYQQQYYKDLMGVLRSSGCKEGDLYMAFGENQMAVYLAGGYIDGRLPYHYWQYKQFEKEAPRAFILFKKEEEGVVEHFHDAGWGFPKAYERIEMRQMAENMGEELSTVVYVKTKNSYR